VVDLPPYLNFRVDGHLFRNRITSIWVPDMARTGLTMEEVRKRIEPQIANWSPDLGGANGEPTFLAYGYVDQTRRDGK